MIFRQVKNKYLMKKYKYNMGWFSNAFGFGKKVLGNLGGVLRKVGDIGGNIAKKVGEFASPIGNIIGTAIDGLAAVTGQPELIPLGEGIRAAGNFVQGWADKANTVAGHVSNAGNKISDFHASLGE